MKFSQEFAVWANYLPHGFINYQSSDSFLASQNLIFSTNNKTEARCAQASINHIICDLIENLSMAAFRLQANVTQTPFSAQKASNQLLIFSNASQATATKEERTNTGRISPKKTEPNCV